MAINEKIVTGRKFRRLIDKEAKLWQRFSWWTKGSDVEFDDGKTAEQKVGNINGITSNFTINDSAICASSKLTNKIKTDLNNGIINEHIQFVIDEDGNLGWKKDGADAVINFSNVIGLNEKMKVFSTKTSSPGHDSIYYLNGNCIPIIVNGSGHHLNGVNYYDSWNIFTRKTTTSGRPNMVLVTPIASYTTKLNKNNQTVIDQIVAASSGDMIVGWKIICRHLDDEHGVGFSCYYIDGQSNLKYDNLYKFSPTLEASGNPYPLVV